MNIAIAFVNDDELLEKNNFFVINDIEVHKAIIDECFNCKLNKTFNPVNYSNYIPEENFILSYNKENEVNYNYVYKCYFVVSSTLVEDELKKLLIDELIKSTNKKILRLDEEISNYQSDLKCLLDLKN